MSDKPKNKTDGHEIESPITMVFVRHAQASDDNRDLTRAEDPPLTNLGKRQATRVARRLQTERFVHAYVSTLLRAKETMRAVLDYHAHVKLTETKDLVEVTRDHFVSVPSAFRPAPKAIVESERDAMARFANGVRHTHEPGDRVLVVAHGNLIRSLMPILGGRNPQESVLIEINNAAVTILDIWSSGSAVLRLANCVRHLLPGEVT